MKKPLIGLALLSLSTTLLAETRELTIGKGLDFKITYKQSIESVEVTDERIKLIPVKNENGGEIPYVVACANVPMSGSEFSRLESILFTTGALVPSANLKSKYGGSRTGIGSNDVTLSADFPDALNKGNQYKASLMASLASTDPANRTTVSLSSNIYQNSELESENNTYNELKSERYQFVKMAVSVESREGFEMTWSVPPKLRAMIESYMSPNDLEHEYQTTPYDYSAISSVVSKLKLSGSPSSLAPKEEGKISVCWKANNYSSITQEGAQLLKPKLTLTFK